MKKIFFYLLVALAIFSGQFLYERNMVFGKPPIMPEQTISGQSVARLVKQGPGIIYFWADWCSLCKMMQAPVSQILADYPGVAVAVKSGDQEEVVDYLKDNGLHWPVANDERGKLSDAFGVYAVPAVFYFNKNGKIIFANSGYSTELGMRFRLWLTRFF